MNKWIVASYLGALLVSCTTDRMANASSYDECNKTYTTFVDQQHAFDVCGRQYRCYWTYRDIVEHNEIQVKLFDCYKEKVISHE